jgi:hypothetical protein
MISDDSLINQLQNGLARELKEKIVVQYKSHWEIHGFEKGFIDCQNTMRMARMKRVKAAKEKVGRLLDEIRDEIWKKMNP